MHLNGRPDIAWGEIPETTKRPSPVTGGRGDRPHPRELQPCGTMAAYKRHRKRDETPCDACAEANRQDYRSRYNATGAGKAESRHNRRPAS